MATSAQYAATPNTFIGNIATSKTNSRANGTTTSLVPMVSAAANGTRIDAITFHAQAGAGDVTASTAANLYLYIGTSTSDAKCFQEIQIGAVTPTVSTPSWSASLSNMGLVLKTGYTLYASVSTSPSVAIDFVGTMAGDL